MDWELKNTDFSRKIKTPDCFILIKLIFLSNLQAKRFADADAGRAKKNNVADDSMDVAKELMNTAKDLTISRVCVSTVKIVSVNLFLVVE